MNEEKPQLSDSILQKIEDGAIQPKSKWSFLLKEYSLWGLGLLSILIGSLAVSIIYFLLRNNDWDIYEQLTDEPLGFVLGSMPYIWLIILAGFILLAHYQVQHTKHGYKYPLSAMILFIVGASTFGGAVLAKAGMGKIVHTQLSEHSLLYREHVDPKFKRWAHPGEGRLAGEVKELEEQSLKLEDDTGKSWDVLFPTEPLLHEFIPELGERIRVLGDPIDEETIQAKQILPWDIDRKRLREAGEKRLETKSDELRTRLHEGM
jgi:hypothetical protein